MHDALLFKKWFRDRETWEAWTAFLCALFGLPMTLTQHATFSTCTGRTEIPNAMAREAWLVVGRRGGKSFVLAFVAVFLACFIDHRPFLAPGELGSILIIASDRSQARVINRYIRALLSIPLLAKLVVSQDRFTTELSTMVVIEIATASFRSTRGYAIIAALCDEIAFWPTDEGAAEPDAEVLAALRPGMLQFKSPLLLCASSPYAMRGELYSTARMGTSSFGKRPLAR
jgi:hypothetical protein